MFTHRSVGDRRHSVGAGDCIHREAAIEQELDNPHVAPKRRGMQRASAINVEQPHVGTTRQ